MGKEIILLAINVVEPNGVGYDVRFIKYLCLDTQSLFVDAQSLRLDA
jgi:hypothetical protein